MKRNILFSALFIGLVVAVFGQDVVRTFGQPQGNINQTFKGLKEGNGTITIIGYNGRVKDVIIPENVKISEKEVLPIGAIGRYAFYNNELTSVTIPNSVTAIGKNAFNKNKLTSVIIGNSVTSIASYAFFNNKPASITIGANVSIDTFAFQGSFRSDYNRGGKKAGTYVLQTGRYVLQETEPSKIAGETSDSIDVTPSIGGVKENNNTITITGSYFSGMVKDIIIPEKIKISEEELPVGAIGNNVFNYERWPKEIRLTSVTIPNSVTSIGKSAFANNNLTSVTIPNSVTSIGEKAFENNKLTSITIGANVSIDLVAFDGSFINNYNKGGKKAGTYVLRTGKYVLQE